MDVRVMSLAGVVAAGCLDMARLLDGRHYRTLKPGFIVGGWGGVTPGATPHFFTSCFVTYEKGTIVFWVFHGVA
jgi:hypothetical protein